ncbi:hypothetical protein JGH11_03625 [Dysgonomonas sp. Marseille-P4677]|uniref:DUF3329 domain-containing protein n=1 Tax=Dysgonomonas sp. Marseille-P4677 TaxID=2364790 RepID=UPI001914D4C9|nr:DUF6056 family protein [Dysgonomonas sp. Marseille-P4677]MBK5719954.1 hypothetical protein [Dysgonomonas sp. Marseille-P4677]
MTDNRLQKLTLIGLACLFFVFVFVLNRLYPLYADDWGYIYSNDSFIPLCKEVLGRLYSQYMTWGGRSVVHGIAHVLSNIGHNGKVIVNSLAFIAYIYMIYCISNKGKNPNCIFFLLLGLILWLVLPAFNSTVLWLVGSANYLWGTFIVILFLYPYYSYYISGKFKDNYLKAMFFFLVGIFSGWTNENMFAAQIFFIIGWGLLLRYNKMKIPVWAILGFLGVCIGGLIMILAPGNYLRSEVVNESLGLVDKSLLENIAYRVLKVGYRYLVYIFPISIVYVVLLYFFKKRLGRQAKDSKILLGSLLFFATAHIAWMSMVASPIFPPRAAFGIVSLLIIALGVLYADMDKKRLRNINIGMVSILLLAFLINFYFQYRSINYLSEEFGKRELYLEEQKAKGHKDISFDNKIELPSRYDFEDLSDDPEYWLNEMYAKYYGINSVRVIYDK